MRTFSSVGMRRHINAVANRDGVFRQTICPLTMTTSIPAAGSAGLINVPRLSLLRDRRRRSPLVLGKVDLLSEMPTPIGRAKSPGGQRQSL